MPRARCRVASTSGCPANDPSRAAVGHDVEHPDGDARGRAPRGVDELVDELLGREDAGGVRLGRVPLLGLPPLGEDGPVAGRPGADEPDGRGRRAGGERGDDDGGRRHEPAVPADELADPVPGRRRAGLNRLVGQEPQHVRRQGVGRRVPPGPVLLDRPADDPVELPGDPPLEARPAAARPRSAPAGPRPPPPPAACRRRTAAGPVSSSYSTAPSPYTSARVSTSPGSSPTCSGLMYCGVPRSCSCRVSARLGPGPARPRRRRRRPPWRCRSRSPWAPAGRRRRRPARCSA